MNLSTKFSTYLQTPIYGHVLGLFRLVFGLFMVYEMVDYIQIDLVRNAFILPKVTLGYIEFIKPLPEPVLDVMLWSMLACAVLMALGLLFKPACFVFGTFYGYFVLLDKGIFNNHLYLFVLLGFMFGLTHADRFFSLRNFWDKQKMVDLRVPRWELFIFQLIFAIVYFYGGLAKINPDWLFRMEPMRSMVTEFPADHPMAFFLKHDFQIPFLTYGGLLFDLLVPLLLWYKPTRIWALFPVLFFHLSNANIFADIGIFPFAMVFATILFFPVEEIPFLKKMVAQKSKSPALLSSPGWVTKSLVVFFVFQLLFPFRGLFLPNPVNWTMVANRFSWRMKCQSKFVDEFKYTIQEGPTGEPIPVEINKFINPMQINIAAGDAIAAADVAKMLAVEGRRRGMKDPVVKANIRVRWNGYPPANTVNPAVDLSKVEVSPFKKMDWVMPVPK